MEDVKPENQKTQGVKVKHGPMMIILLKV